MYWFDTSSYSWFFQISQDFNLFSFFTTDQKPEGPERPESMFTTPSIVHVSNELHISFSYLVAAPKIRIAKAVNFGSSAKSRPRCHRQRCHDFRATIGGR